MARSHWARWLPQQYAAISDPDSFFSEIGQEAARQDRQLATELAGDSRPGENYLARAGRLASARSQPRRSSCRSRSAAARAGRQPGSGGATTRCRRARSGRWDRTQHPMWAEISAEQEERIQGS